MKYFLLTFKALKEQNPSAQLYMDFLGLCIKRHKQICLMENCFETDQTNKLHFHCIVTARYVRFNDYVRYCFENDMYFHFVEIKTDELVNVVSYLQKQKLDPHEIEQKQYANMARTEYLFI